VGADQPRRPLRVACRQRVLHGPLGVAVLLPPHGRAEVQRRDLLGVLLGEHEAEHVAQQRVVAEPEQVVVGGPHEHVPPLQVAQPRHGAGRADHGVAQRPGHAVQQRRPQQERGRLGRLALEDL
jgi:hypothetical protein